MNDLVTNVASMTLKEITDLLNVRHDKAMVKVAEMAEDPAFGWMSKMDIQYSSGKGRIDQIETYQLDKRQSIAVAARLKPKSSVSELMYSFRNYCQRNGLYRIPGCRGFGYSYTDAQFKVSLKEVAGIWSVRELKHHTTDDLKVRLESRMVDFPMLCV